VQLWPASGATENSTFAFVSSPPAHSLHSNAAGCSETQQRQIYVCTQILDMLHLKMFLLHRGQMSALHPLMKFPLHGDEMVVLSEAVAHSPHDEYWPDLPRGNR
jgi:hypothetical protein